MSADTAIAENAEHAGDLFKQLCRCRGVSFDTVASQAHLHPSHLVALSRGSRRFTLATSIMIGLALGVAGNVLIDAQSKWEDSNR